MCYALLCVAVYRFCFQPRVAGNYSSRPSTFSSWSSSMLSTYAGQFSFLFSNLSFLPQYQHLSCLCSVQFVVRFLMALTLLVWPSPFIVFVWDLVISFTYLLRLHRWLASARIYSNSIVFVLLLLSFRSLLQLFEWVVSEFYFLLSPNSQDSVCSLSFIANSEIVSLFNCLILLNKRVACFVSVSSGDLIFFLLLHNYHSYFILCSVNI